MTRAYVSVGSNVDREAHVRTAVDALGARFGPLVLSPVYETGAVGFEGEPFLNLVVGLDTELPAGAVVEALKAIEHALGRTPESRGFHPRTLDLDLLLYGEEIIQTADFHVPRDEILCHAFVLAPLADIAPDLRHPATGRTMAELWATFDAGDQWLRKVPLNFRVICGASRRAGRS